MSLPWHIPLEVIESFKKKNEKTVEPTILKHYCNFNIHCIPGEELHTALMCEIGINNIEPATIQRLLAAGMTVAKLNVRELEPDVRGQLVQSVRQAVYNYSAELDFVYPLALMVEVRGPDIMTGIPRGGLRATIELLAQQSLRLTTDPAWRECETVDCVYVGWDHLTDLLPDDVIFIDSLSSGRIKAVVTEVGEDAINCLVLVGGTIGAHMTVRISKIPRENDSEKGNGDSNSSGSITCSQKSSQQYLEHVEQQVRWAIGADVDAVLIPNTQTVHDIRHIKDILGEKGKHMLIFSSIDTIHGFDNIDEILCESDGLYLDRGVLSIDLPIEKIFMAQKILTAKCNAAGKPCICKAVINEQIPTLCVSDIANLVIDRVDVLALELHYESPLKKLTATHDSVQMAENCIAAAAVICRNAEIVLWQPCIYGNVTLMQSLIEEPTKAICVSAVELAIRSSAVVIVCLTNSGKTAKTLSHIGPSCPIIAVTRVCHTARQLRFWRGVNALHYFDTVKSNWADEIECRVLAALDYCKGKRAIRSGDAYVLVTGSRRGVGYCDSVRLLYASIRQPIRVD